MDVRLFRNDTELLKIAQANSDVNEDAIPVLVVVLRVDLVTDDAITMQVRHIEGGAALTQTAVGTRPYLILEKCT